jgi:hypothetical protein
MTAPWPADSALARVSDRPTLPSVGLARGGGYTAQRYPIWALGIDIDTDSATVRALTARRIRIGEDGQE